MPIPYKVPPVMITAPEKKKRKPRQKRRYQTMAEKDGQPQTYKWTQLLGSYQFNPDENVSASLTESAGWDMVLVVNGQRYSGNRPTLEEAFKALADLMFQKAKKYWLKMDDHIVMAPWMWTLPEDL